jgi:hypothetical protein
LVGCAALKVFQVKYLFGKSMVTDCGKAPVKVPELGLAALNRFFVGLSSAIV